MLSHPSSAALSRRRHQQIFLFIFISLTVVFLVAACRQEPEAANPPPAEMQNEAKEAMGENDRQSTQGQGLIAEIPAAAAENRVTLVEEMPAAPVKKSASFTTEVPEGIGEKSGPLKSLSGVKRMLENRQYYALTRLTFSKTQLPQLYYKANAYYVLSLTEKRGSAKHIAYARRAKALFERVARHTKNPRLRNRAVLWHGITTFRYPSRREGSKEQLRPFSYLLRQGKNTALYNDALLYSAFIYTRYKNFAEAERLYRRLGKTDARDGVYDYRVKKVVSPQRASAFYLGRLANLKRPGKPATSAPPATPAPMQLDSEEVVPFPEEEEFLDPPLGAVPSENEVQRESEAAISEQEEATFFAPPAEVEFETAPAPESQPEGEVAPEATSLDEAPSLDLEAPFLQATPPEASQLETEDTVPEALQNQ